MCLSDVTCILEAVALRGLTMNHMNGPDIVKTVTIKRFQWAAHVIRMLDHNPTENYPPET
jgi:hypothetical protein